MPAKKILRIRVSVFFDNGGHQMFDLDPKVDVVKFTPTQIVIKRASPKTTIEIDRKKTTHFVQTDMWLDPVEIELRKRAFEADPNTEELKLV